MIEAIYGRVEGQDGCGQKPRRNCTLSAYCYIFDKINGRSSSQRPKVNNSLVGDKDPCPGESKYLVVKYRCGQWRAPSSGKYTIEVGL